MRSIYLRGNGWFDKQQQWFEQHVWLFLALLFLPEVAWKAYAVTGAAVCQSLLYASTVGIGGFILYWSVFGGALFVLGIIAMAQTQKELNAQ